MNILVDEIVVRGIHGAAIVRIRCPYCRKKHSHGLGVLERPVLGQRLAHCGKGSYILVDTIDDAKSSPAHAHHKSENT